MKRATIVYPLRNNRTEVLMGIKQRIVGVGCFFGFGGKIENETPTASAVREAQEETSGKNTKGISILEQDLEPVALIDFYIGKELQNDDPNFRVLFYITDKFTGEPDPDGNSEMKNLTWFPCEKLPVDVMIVGDEFIIPHVVKGQLIKGYIRMSEDEKKVLDMRIHSCGLKDLVI